MKAFMNRRQFAALLVSALAACSGAAKPPGFPATLAGVWKQSGVANPPAPAPLLGAYAPEQTWEAVFSGPSPLTVTYYRMKAETVAFELMQKWRPEPGTTHFHHGPMFVVVRAAGVEPAKLNAIAREVEEALKR